MAAESAQFAGSSPEDFSKPDRVQAQIGVSSVRHSQANELSALSQGRATFGTHELAIVLSHFDIGVVEAVQEFPRGSSKSPKLVFKTDQGLFLLKRRATAKHDAYKVAFSHQLQMHLAEKQFPLPHLIGTRRNNNSMLQHDGAIYEMFEYIKGSGYDGSLDATMDAGKTLSLFHKLLRDHQYQYEPAKGSYHDSQMVKTALERIPQTMDNVSTPAVDAEGKTVAGIVDNLTRAYQHAIEKATSLGLSQWPEQIVHSDWHPGNMLFRGSRVVAVIDYDAARVQQRVLDAGNGALQFSILGGSENPLQWPDYLDESRFKRFVRGYDSVPDSILTKRELRVMPWLMIEALIAEMTIPIANSGQFGRMDGGAILLMIERKVTWLERHADQLYTAVED